jgi:hypothetical protein
VKFWGFLNNVLNFQLFSSTSCTIDKTMHSSDIKTTILFIKLQVFKNDGVIAWKYSGPGLQIRILPKAKLIRKTFFSTFYNFFITFYLLKNDVNVPSTSNEPKKIFVCVLKVTDEQSRIRTRIR